jgi:tRNA (guanine37-N1)-methyltransferase
MIIDILSGFPEVFTGLVNSSIPRNALMADALELWVHDLRHYTTDRHGKIDDTPYGGGAGMVLMAQPVFACLDAVRAMRAGTPQLLFMSAQGERLTQPLVRGLSGAGWLIVLCGHYKDVDARVFERDAWREISLGDYILSGGELPAAVLVDAIARLLPGVLGNEDSAAGDSFERGLLDAPYYTKPEEIAGLRVPEAMLSGHHGRIDEWRAAQRLARTRSRRPDLTGGSNKSEENN